MNLLKNEIERRNLPDLFTFENGTAVTPETWESRRCELRDILCREEYGDVPEVPTDVHAVPVRMDENMCAGKVRGEYFRVAFTTPMGEWSFPVCLFIPKNPRLAGGKSPCVIHINFRPDVPDKYYPLEEITDAGFATAQIYYQDVASDDRDFTNGIAAMYPGNNGSKGDNAVRDDRAWGKIQMWAFAASRLLDVLLTRDDIARDKIFVAGHSRLGKTALVTAAMDERFAGACSNDSGCSGAAITREKTGERVTEITNNFPYWFCKNYMKYRGGEYTMPFDQHFLTALIAPRLICIGSAQMDSWADPNCEFMTAALTSCVQTFLKDGSVPALEDIRYTNGLSADRCPCPGESFTFADGRTHYHERFGTHFFSREDWNQYLAFFAGHFYR